MHILRGPTLACVHCWVIVEAKCLITHGRPSSGRPHRSGAQKQRPSSSRSDAPITTSTPPEKPKTYWAYRRRAKRRWRNVLMCMNCWNCWSSGVKPRGLLSRPGACPGSANGSRLVLGSRVEVAGEGRQTGAQGPWPCWWEEVPSGRGSGSTCAGQRQPVKLN